MIGQFLVVPYQRNDTTEFNIWFKPHEMPEILDFIVTALNERRANEACNNLNDALRYASGEIDLEMVDHVEPSEGPHYDEL